MTEITLLILVLMFLVVCFVVVHFYDKKLVKSIAEHEKRLEEKGILKRHFSKPTSNWCKCLWPEVELNHRHKVLISESCGFVSLCKIHLSAFVCNDFIKSESRLYIALSDFTPPFSFSFRLHKKLKWSGRGWFSRGN